MAFVFTWAGALGLVASLCAVGLGVLVFWTRPGRSQNRRLALMLSVDGLSFLGGTGMMFLTDSLVSAWAWQALTALLILAVPFAYLLFLATLDTPLARPLRHPVVEKSLVAGLVLAPLLWFLYPGAFVEGLVPGDYTPWDALLGPAFLATLTTVVTVSLVGLVLAISVWRRSKPGTVQRVQARSYAVAFGCRDVGLPLSLVLFILAEGGLGGSALAFAASVVLPASILLAFVLLLAYGILKTQLFDIDLKLKFGLEKSTIAAVFGVAFLTVSEIVETLLGVEGTFYGVAGAVAIGLFFRRIEQGAAYVADRLMPGVEDTQAYRETRKRQVYRASIEELLADGEVTAKERRMLGRLQEELGLAGGEASRIEADVVEAGSDPA